MASGLVDWRRMYRDAEQLLSSLGVHLDLKTKARYLSVAQQQMVEIARALSVNARILIMDEPTSALTLNEVADLFQIVRRLRENGTAILSSRIVSKSCLKSRIESPCCAMGPMWIRDQWMA